FRATDEITGAELWKSDGTPGGTVQAADVYPGRPDSEPCELTRVGNAVFFSAYDPITNGTALWRSDGNGATRVTDLEPGADSCSSVLTDVAGTFFFRKNFALWKSDGITTTPVTNFGIGELIAVGNVVFFDGCAGDCKLWKTDGTSTVIVADVPAGNLA